MKLSTIAGLACAALAQSVDASPARPRGDDCYALPGDSNWPAQDKWNKLNSTVNGRLVATVPIGSPCHDPTFDQAACDQLKANWLNPLTQ
jgi:hypothetical protein